MVLIFLRCGYKLIDLKNANETTGYEGNPRSQNRLSTVWTAKY